MGRIKKFNRVLSVMMVLIMLFTSIGIEQFKVEAKEQNSNIKLYFVDNTESHWFKNDNAVIEAVDNTSGHDHYVMTKENDETWSVEVPSTAYNITFNRLNSDGTVQWNSWSAGGRDSNNTYYADGAEYGHWEYSEESNENYFHAGDIIYLDLTEFPEWKNDNAKLYINFSDASKQDSNIDISSVDKALYDPKSIDVEVIENVYAYVVKFEDVGQSKLRFWRGNSTTLWNNSIVLTYDEFVDGLNCIKIKNWNNNGEIKSTVVKMNIESDSDCDGLSDYSELIINTDINNMDTDEDGLLDSHELYLTKSNPCRYDSLNSGVSDFDFDNDKDGLCNGNEVNFGTDPNCLDSDNDCLSDGDEINYYLSDPMNADTDGDTLNDGDEIYLKFSPLLKDTDNNGVLDCDERILQNLIVNIESVSKKEISSVSVEFEGTGNINSTTTVEDLYEKDAFISDTVGLIGSPIEIKSCSNFDKAKITFYLNPSISCEETTDFLILWYDELNDRYVEQETIVNNTEKTISAEVNHFSKYMVVDKSQWFDAWKNEIKYENPNKKFDTVISIDCSGSMRSNDPDFKHIVKNTLYPGSSYEEITCYRKLASKSFVNSQNDNDQTGIVLFESSSNVACGLTNEKNDLNHAIDNIYSDGGTNFDSAISKSIDLLKNSRADSEKMILLVSDGESSVSQSVINSAINNKISINTVYIGEGNDNELLKNISSKTGGAYFKAVTADQLVSIYSNIIVGQKIDGTDSDKDGIADIFEVSGMKLSNGSVIYTDPNNPDTDGDGLLDGEEISTIPAYWLHNIFDKYGISIQVGAYIFGMKSNPNSRDSDNDGLLDGKPTIDNKTKNKIAPKDPNPMKADGLEGMWKKHIEELKNGDRVAHYLDDWYNYETNISWKIWDWNWKDIAAGLGSRALMFKKDEKNIAVHSQVKAWQSVGGYNDIYDDIFHLGTFGNMDRNKFEFNCDGENYVIWTWKGDYLNLGSGAEIGIYTNVHTIGIPKTSLKIDQWEVDENCALKMKLYLYNYYSSSDVDNIFCWEPNEPQWWITGFNPDLDNPNVNDMISIGVIDFEDNTQMYDALKNNANDYLIFDEDGHTVWMMWGE